MFKFLKDKLKNAISLFGKKVEEKIEEPLDTVKKTRTREKITSKPLKKTKFEKPKVPIKEITKKIEELAPAQVTPKKLEIKKEAEPTEQNKGFFKRITQKITTKTITPELFEELFWNLELALLENNVAVEVIEKLKKDLQDNLVNKSISRSQIESTITKSLENSIESILKKPTFDLVEYCRKQNKPVIICFFGVNGSGKTTTIAKIAHKLKKEGMEVILAAADTFRAAAIDQLQTHADAIGVKLIKHEYGADAAAVAYDAIAHAKSKNKDVVLIDTAGRLHSNTNLMEEMKKIVRVAKPNLKIFIGESITGNDCTEQAKAFDKSIGIDAVILAKADIDEKGGASLSIGYTTQKPILYLGTGQLYDDLETFTPSRIMESLGLAKDI